VHGVDTNRHAVDTINGGNVHIYEPSLDVLVRSAVMSGQLTAASKPVPADVFIIAVPTPFKGAHEPDLRHVENAARSIAPVLAPGNLVVLESTSPVGTTERLAAWISECRPDLCVPTRKMGAGRRPPTTTPYIAIAHCPERVLPGQILKELVEVDRVIGGIDPESAEAAADLYRAFADGEIIVTDSRTAEMAKLTENAFRDVNIAFANELAVLCDEMHIDVWQLISLANRHPRVSILQPGPGVGGHCIAVDPWFIVHASPANACLIRTARSVNDAMPARVVKRVLEAASALSHPVIACLGLSFKADVDDLRESPALKIVDALSARAVGELLVVEPHVQSLPAGIAERGIRLVGLPEALREANVIVILVNHREFGSLASVEKGDRIVIDTRGVWR